MKLVPALAALRAGAESVVNIHPLSKEAQTALVKV